MFGAQSGMNCILTPCRKIIKNIISKKNYLQQSFPLLAFLNFLKPKKVMTPMKPKPTSISIILTLFYKIKLNPAEIVKSEVELFNPTEPIIV